MRDLRLVVNRTLLYAQSLIFLVFFYLFFLCIVYTSPAAFVLVRGREIQTCSFFVKIVKMNRKDFPLCVNTVEHFVTYRDHRGTEDHHMGKQTQPRVKASSFHYTNRLSTVTGKCFLNGLQTKTDFTQKE